MFCDYFIVLKFYSLLQKKKMHGDKLQFAITHFLQILDSIKHKTFFCTLYFYKKPDL